jgi:hypothetical protein
VRWRPAPGARPRLLGEILVVLLLVFVYDRVRDVAATRAGEAVGNARGILSVERWLHLDVEGALNAVLSRHHGTELAVSWYYQTMHLTATLLVLLWLYWRRASLYRVARRALVAINAFALLVFWAYPVAPPRLVPGLGFIDSAVVTGVAARSTTVTPDLFAAMPSLHIAWATWVVLQVLAGTRLRWARGLAIAHLSLTSVVVLATANHYLLDVVAGVALALVVQWGVRWTPGADVSFRHGEPARGGGRQPDREAAGVRLARQRAPRDVGAQG